MASDPPSKAERGKGWVATGLVFLIGASLAFGIRFALTRDADDALPENAAIEDLPAKPGDRLAVKPSSAVGPMAADADGPSIPRPPRASNPTLCDEALWPRLEVFVKEVRGDEALIDEGAWDRQNQSARTGVASWISKCRLEGRAVRLLGKQSQRVLAEYDSERGYRAVDESEPYDPERD